MSEIPYDATYQPPAPVLDIALMAPATGSRVKLTGIIDTGADATIIPLQFLQQIGARRVFATGLKSQWGERRTVFLYLVDVRISSITLPAIYVVGDELGEDIVVGRDVLNRLRILLNGPDAVAQIWDTAQNR